MSSGSLEALNRRIGEVKALALLDPSRRDPLNADRLVVNAINRACIVLLSAHLEGYIEALATESVDFLQRQEIQVDQIPILLKLLQCEPKLTQLAITRDRRSRARQVRDLFNDAADLWGSGILRPGLLSASLLVAEMANPGSREIERFFEYLGVGKLFELLVDETDVDVKATINEVVGKRNSIAHGETDTGGTASDIDRYIDGVSEFARQLDKILARQVRDLCQTTSFPWAV